MHVIVCCKGVVRAHRGLTVETPSVAVERPTGECVMLGEFSRACPRTLCLRPHQRRRSSTFPRVLTRSHQTGQHEGVLRGAHPKLDWPSCLPSPPNFGSGPFLRQTVTNTSPTSSPSRTCLFLLSCRTPRSPHLDRRTRSTPLMPPTRLRSTMSRVLESLSRSSRLCSEEPSSRFVALFLSLCRWSPLRIVT